MNDIRFIQLHNSMLGTFDGDTVCINDMRILFELQIEALIVHECMHRVLEKLGESSAIDFLWDSVYASQTLISANVDLLHTWRDASKEKLARKKEYDKGYADGRKEGDHGGW